MQGKLINNKYSFKVVRNKQLFDIIEDRISCPQHGSTVIVPHVCNNINAFGAGFAGQTAVSYPVVKANFHMLGQSAKLGYVQFVKAKSDPQHKHSIIFANMIAQNKIIGPDNPRPLNYGALALAMHNIKTYIRSAEKDTESNRIEIHAPKFGSGLAGGNWNFIAELINDIWSDIPVFIYTFK
jgi:hypothetical protein